MKKEKNISKIMKVLVSNSQAWQKRTFSSLLNIHRSNTIRMAETATPTPLKNSQYNRSQLPFVG
jgi:hypothetical protein